MTLNPRVAASCAARERCPDWLYSDASAGSTWIVCSACVEADPAEESTTESASSVVASVPLSSMTSSPSSDGASSCCTVEWREHPPEVNARSTGDQAQHLLRTWQGSTSKPKHLVGGGLRVMLAVPASCALSLSFFLVGMCWCLFQSSVDVEDTLELAEHKAEYACRYTERRAEHNTDIPHRHLIDVRVLDDENQMRGECAEKAVVGDGQCRYQMRKFANPFLGIHEV